MPSTLNPLAPRLSMLAGDTVAMQREDALNIALKRAPARGRQSVRPAHYDGTIVLWLVQDVRYVAARPEVYDEVAEQVHAC